MSWKEILKDDVRRNDRFASSEEDRWAIHEFISKGRELLDEDIEKLLPNTGKFEHKCRIWLENFQSLEQRIEMESQENYEGKKTGAYMIPAVEEFAVKISRKYYDTRNAREKLRD